MKRWLTLFAVLALAAAATLAIVRWRQPGTLEGRFDCVRAGMTRDQVERVMKLDLGTPLAVDDDTEPGERDYYAWPEVGGSGKYREFRFFFDKDGRVTRKGIYYVID
jgi:SmpA/OmlA family protein